MFYLREDRKPRLFPACATVHLLYTLRSRYIFSAKSLDSAPTRSSQYVVSLPIFLIHSPRRYSRRRKPYPYRLFAPCQANHVRLLFPNFLFPPTNPSPLSSHCGLGTVYTQQGGTGSCGHKLPDSSLVIALSNVWQLGQSPGPYCGRKIQVTNTGSDSGTGGKGNTVIATVQDMCPGCDRERLDFSVGAWNQLTNGAAFGTINICWYVLLLS